MSMPPSAKMRRPVKLAPPLAARAGRPTTILIIVAVLTAALFSTTSSATFRRGGRNAAPSASAHGGAVNPAGEGKASGPARVSPRAGGVAPAFFPALLQAAPPLLPDSIDTYAADCTTLKDAFTLGETVCAKVTDGPSLSIIPRRVALIDPSGNVREVAAVTTLPGTVSFTLPSAQTTMIDSSTFDNRGAWKVNVIPGSRFSVRASASFSVSDPQQPVADLFIYNANNTGGTTTAGASGTNITYTLWLGNRGADEATNVVVTDDVPAHATFVSLVQDFGPTFNCTTPTAGSAGTVTCNVASLARGEFARISLVYELTPGTQAGTVVTNTATISSDTDELLPADNTAISDVEVVGGASEACSLVCPSDISRPATTTVNNVRGANVTFAPESVGDCGTITSTPASGSFFPVGTTSVTVAAEGGGSCSFIVTVTDEAGPTISCPADKSATAAPGDCETSVDPGTATATGTGVTVDAERSDSRALTDPYPGGVTTITWTATDSQGLTAVCTQTITVAVNDSTAPTITAPNDITVGTGQDGVLCAVVIGDGSLGTAETDDNCPTSVKVTRTGIPSGNLFPKGTTTITYTATDGGGNTATATQKVTVVDNTAPVIYAPADAAYTCPSEVPAASPSQAGGPLLDAAGQPLRDANGELQPGGQPFDNCGAPLVTVTETSTGAGSAASPKVITRTYTATDSSGNSASAVQTITVADPTPPTITAPADKVLYTGPGATSCGVTVANLDGTLGTATASDNCGAVSVTRGGGNSFPVGETIVTYTATDAAGNTASATQKVTVIDNTPPAISCPVDITVGFNPGVNGAAVTYTAPTGTDNCAGATTAQTAGLASGATFPLGTTTNTFTVTDAAGNTASCSFKVTVALTSIVGLDSVSISGAAYADSYDSNGGYPATKGSLASVVSNGTITLAGSGKVFGSVRSTQAGVVMTGASQVTGNATAATTVSRSGSASVGGTITNNAPAPSVALPAVPSCGPPYSSNAGISGSYSYNAGTGDLSLSGVNIATLANGTYCFRNVTVGNSAELKVNGPVVIKITGTLSVSGAAKINNTTAVPSNLRILSSYSGSNGVSFGNGSNSYLLVYAPRTGVTISGAGPLFGTVAGKTVTLSNSGPIHYDTRLLSIWPDTWAQILGP